MTELAAICLGANLGARAETLAAAVAELAATPGLSDFSASRVYETEPVDVVDQPPFLNQVVRFRCTLSPEALLARCREIETRFGRTREVRRGPRTLDLDLLFLGTQVVDSPALTLPHPRLHERRFVLEPLVDLDPMWRHPRLGLRAVELYAALPDSAWVRPYEPVRVS